MSRFKVGDRVKIYKPGHAEHGARGVVADIITIQEYGGYAYRGPHAYACRAGWAWPDGYGVIGGYLPDAMVTADEEGEP